MTLDRPAIIVSEYTGSFGLRAIAEPYDAQFDSIHEHDSYVYYAASSSTLHPLTSCHASSPT